LGRYGGRPDLAAGDPCPARRSADVPDSGALREERAVLGEWARRR
jgi:hypothetical protein